MEKSRATQGYSTLTQKSQDAKSTSRFQSLLFLPSIVTACLISYISLMPASANGASRPDMILRSKAPPIPLTWFPAYLAEIPEEGHSGAGCWGPFSILSSQVVPAPHTPGPVPRALQNLP